MSGFLTPKQKMQIAMSDAELNTWIATPTKDGGSVELYGSRDEASTENLLLDGVEMIARDRDGKWHKLSYDFEKGGIIATPKGK